MINHYFGDHMGCREYEIEDEDGNMVTWCGFHRVGPHYKFKMLKNGEALDPVFRKKIKKARGQPAPDPPYEEIQFKEEILKLFQPFIEQKFLEQVTSGKNTNPNESFHSKASSQMGGKHTCKTQGGFYVGAMRAATLRYSIGESYSECSTPSASPSARRRGNETFERTPSPRRGSFTTKSRRQR